MVKFLFIQVALLLSVFISSAVTPGKIKSITEYYYSVGENQDSTELKKIILRVYGKNGDLLEDKELNAKGAISRKTVYHYDNSGQLAEKIFYSDNDSFTYRSGFIYNKELQSKECRNFDGKGRLVSKTISYVNEPGKVIRIDTFTAEEKLYNSQIFEYNSNNQETTERIVYPDGSTEWESESVYDPKGNLIEKMEIPSCCLSIKRSYSYDQDGNLTGESSVNAIGSQGTQYSYRYSNTDRSGNWLTKLILENGKPTTRIKRTIEYFE